MYEYIKKKIRGKLNGIPKNVFIINFFFQKIFRVDASCSFSKN